MHFIILPTFYIQNCHLLRFQTVSNVQLSLSSCMSMKYWENDPRFYHGDISAEWIMDNEVGNHGRHWGPIFLVWKRTEEQYSTLSCLCTLPWSARLFLWRREHQDAWMWHARLDEWPHRLFSLEDIHFVPDKAAYWFKKEATVSNRRNWSLPAQAVRRKSILIKPSSLLYPTMQLSPLNK